MPEQYNVTSTAKRLEHFFLAGAEETSIAVVAEELGKIIVYHRPMTTVDFFPKTLDGFNAANVVASANDVVFMPTISLVGDIVLKAGIEYVGLGRGHTILTGNARGADGARLENLSIIRSVNSADDHSGLHMSVEGGVMDVVNCDIVCDNAGAGAGAGWGTLIDDGHVRFIESKTLGSTDGLHIEAIVIESGTPAGPATLTEQAVVNPGDSAYVTSFGVDLGVFQGVRAASGGYGNQSYVVYKLNTAAFGYPGGRLRITAYVEEDTGGNYNVGQIISTDINAAYTPTYSNSPSALSSGNFQTGDTIVLGDEGAYYAFPNGDGYIGILFGREFNSCTGRFKITNLQWRGSDGALRDLWTPGTVEAYTGVPIATTRRTTMTGTTLDINNVDGTCSVSDCDYDFAKTSGTITYLRGDRISRGANEFPALTAKATPVDGDLLLLEDSAAGYAKKKTSVVDLLSGAGVDPHNIISVEHPDTNTAVAPTEGDLLVRRSSLWEAEAGVDIGSDASGISKINADEQGSDPAAPGAGNRILYPKADGWYDQDSAGVVTGPFGTGSGAGSGDHVHGLARWAADGTATVYELPDVAEYLEMVYNAGSAVDQATVTLSADGTRIAFDAAPTGGNILQANYVIARL